MNDRHNVQVGSFYYSQIAWAYFEVVSVSDGGWAVIRSKKTQETQTVPTALLSHSQWKRIETKGFVRGVIKSVIRSLPTFIAHDGIVTYPTETSCSAAVSDESGNLLAASETFTDSECTQCIEAAKSWIYREARQRDLTVLSIDE